MFKPGSIRKIAVKNFVTYSYVEMTPGPNLNMIIGPNGTGKSTMVAAIILGLGGNPKVVGRGTKVSEYVKHNCDSATIHITLQDEREYGFIKVTREFDIRDKSLWRLNDRKVKIDDVLKCIGQFNIQVNNLCQFLPQDRVQDFAKLNKQDLLKETQKALCRFDLINKQELLTQNREEQKELMNSINSSQTKLQEAQDANVRLEGKVQNFKRKKKYTEQIEHIERRIAWMTYEDAREQLRDIKRDKTSAQEVYDQFRNETLPMEQKINKTKQQITHCQQENSKTTQLIRNAEFAISSNLEKEDTLHNRIKTVEDEMNMKLGEIEQWEQEIKDVATKLQEMRQMHAEILAKCDADERESQPLTVELNKLVAHQRVLEDKKEEIVQAKQDCIREIRVLENEMSRLENVKNNRLQDLERRNPDAYKAVCWLRNNKHLFQDDIYEPMMLEINVLDNRHAKYVEAVVPMQDRLAFTCVNKEDMNKLIRCLRGSQNLTINVVHSSDPGNGPSRFQPNMPIEQLRKYGFYNYVNNLFAAPGPIMSYLCKTYGLHNIPIGNDTTNNCYERVPQQIRQFFSDTFRYMINYSKYSGQKITKQVGIYSDGGLSRSLDVVRLENSRGQINDVKGSIQKYEEQIETLQGQLMKVSEKAAILRDKVKALQKGRQQAQSVQSRIQTLENRLIQMQRNKKMPEDVRNATKVAIRQHILGIYPLQVGIRNDIKKLSELRMTSQLTSLKIEDLRKRVAYLEGKIGDNRRRCQEAEETLNKIKDKHTEVMNQCKTLMTKAKSLSNGFMPNDEGFKEFLAEYDKYKSCDLQELNAKKEQLQSRIACLVTSDDGEMREYEERLEQIQNLSEEIEKSTAELNAITTRLDRMQEEWLTPLGQLVRDINFQFASAFERMGCAGEISISTGDNEKDFAQYGLCIKVTYRNGEPLQELNSNIQSGGERAVATAAFMLSLQELTPVPFRCADEINQGMDVNNERRIFELIMDSTSVENSSQYFLVTPKLVKNLNYSRAMKIHIVHNGPFVAQDKKWCSSEFCNSRVV